MAKKNKGVYAPGELSRVRGKLGDLNAEEAKRMAQILGGEVGYERSEKEETERNKPKTRRETVELVVKGSPRRSVQRIDTADPDAGDFAAVLTAAQGQQNKDTADDPSVQIRTPYLERVRMDRYASLPEFDIKTSIQVLVSILSFFSEPADFVSPLLVTRRMNEYYKHIELLVTATRTLFPRNNAKRSERIKKASPFSFSILDTIRHWNIEKINADLGKIQAHPRSVRVSELADILRTIYRPLFILEKLNTEAHIKGAYKLLYKVLYIENPNEIKTKHQENIRTALSSFIRIRKDIHYLLFPLLMKMISDRWLPYEQFFIKRRRRYMAFLKVSALDQIDIPVSGAQPSDDMAAVREDVKNDQADNVEIIEETEESPDDPKVLERKTREAAQEAEQKALDKSLATMEILFPKAGWDRLGNFPDMYPYFADTLKLKKDYELISPTDPMQQISVLMHIMAEFFFAIRYVSFGTAMGADGNYVRVEDFLVGTVNNWQWYIQNSLDKEYLPRLYEYCQMLEQSSESRNSIYAKRMFNELHWAKRLYYLPYYKFETIGPPPFRKNDTTPVYGEIKQLRKHLTAVAAAIEKGYRQGGADSMAPCDGINNPWQPYNFEVPTPISMRLDMLLPPKKRTNAALIYFCLAPVVVLDYLINDENSWAYKSSQGLLFRGIDTGSTVMLVGADNRLDADLIFKTALKQRQQENERQKRKQETSDVVPD